MNRLLQGDVGSGKNCRCGIGGCGSGEAGFQTAIMAPTEILAQQHAKTLDELLSPFGVSVALLTGHVKGAARSQLLDNLASGNI